MEKNLGKKLLSLVIAAVFCLTTFAVTGASVEKVYAEDGGYQLPETFTMTYYPKWKSGSTEWLADDSDVTIDMDSVQNTNPDVISLKYEPPYEYDEGQYSDGYYYMKAKKAGKATLTFNVAVPGTDTWTQATVNVTAYKWLKPCKTFKIGSKSYAKKFTNKSQYGISKKVSGKLVVKPRKGWKITFMEKYVNKTDKFVKVKNNKKITLNKYDDLYVEFQKKGTQRYEYVVLYRYK